MILGRQIALIIGEELDDFNNLTVDSTAVKANSPWPADSKILTALLAHLVNAIRTDIADAGRVLEYAENRVFSDKCLPSKEKILRRA